MATVFFVRHGETTANAEGILQGQQDFLLSPAGRRQAACLASRLAGKPFDAIFTSDLSRASDTAEMIAAGRPVISAPLLREWCFGDWQGRKIEDLRRDFPQEFGLFAADSPLFVPPGGESAGAFRARAAEILSRLAEKHAGETVLCVTHGGLLKQMLKLILNTEKPPLLPVCGNASLSCFRLVRGLWQLVFWNDCSHVTSEAEERFARPVSANRELAL
ncbi:MAG: histidine phosphatase family protein [Lentisphaeria bacterium]|nr:histidine phosphatase family protein [Lentisphaeria bacterium]